MWCSSRGWLLSGTFVTVVVFFSWLFTSQFTLALAPIMFWKGSGIAVICQCDLMHGTVIFIFINCLDSGHVEAKRNQSAGYNGHGTQQYRRR